MQEQTRCHFARHASVWLHAFRTDPDGL